MGGPHDCGYGLLWLREGVSGDARTLPSELLRKEGLTANGTGRAARPAGEPTGLVTASLPRGGLASVSPSDWGSCIDRIFEKRLSSNHDFKFTQSLT